MIGKEKVMVPTNDYVFRRIFAREGSEKITAKFIESITNQKIEILKLNTSPILEKDLKDDKVGILDVYARGENIDYDIERQMANMSNIKERILFYWSKIYLKNINKGDNYKKLKKTVIILIANKEVENLVDLCEYHTKWRLREEKYTKKILTDKMEIHIIELGKINQYVNKNERSLLLWLKFLTKPYEIGGKEMVSNEEVKEEIEILNNLNSSEEEIQKAEMRLDYVRCQNAAEDYGYEKGKAKGKNEEKKRIAKIMLEMKMEDSTISKVTKLSQNEIDDLKIINS